PTPCIRCNGSVRLDAMLGLADRLGCEALATGHYARVRARTNGGSLVRAAADERKDQSYLLAAPAPPRRAEGPAPPSPPRPRASRSPPGAPPSASCASRRCASSRSARDST